MTLPGPQVMADELGISVGEAEAVIDAVRALPLEAKPVQVTIRHVATTTGVTAELVKKALLYLFVRHFLSATFQPRHVRCGKVIGRAESSTDAIREKAEGEEYGTTCPRCYQVLEGQVDVEILFWLGPVRSPDAA